MPPKKSKGGKNGFYYFMLDFKNRNSSISMQEASTQAGVVWDRMGQNERRPYVEKANQMNKGEKGVKYTALHENIDVLKAEEAEKKHAEVMMHNDIHKMLRRMIAANSITKEYFHILHINNFCFANQTRRHYPAEIAMVRFTLEDGVLEKNVYHEIIQPGPLPLGYAYTAKQKSEESHQLPPPIGKSECNIDLVFQTFLLFMKETAVGKDFTFPPIYVSDKDMTLITEIIHQMCDEFDCDKRLFRIYSLQYFFYALQNTLTDQIVWPTINQSVLELERDVFDFTEGIACSYHEDTDVPIHCSRSKVIRYVFIICDNCCKTIQMLMIPGQHVPRKSNLTAFRPSSAASNFMSCRDFSGRTSVASGRMTSVTESDTFYDDEYASAYDYEGSQHAGDWVESRSKGRKKNNGAGFSTTSSVSSLSFQQEASQFSSQPSSQFNSQGTQPERPVRRPFTVSACVNPGDFSDRMAAMQPMPAFGRGRARNSNGNK